MGYLYLLITISQFFFFLGRPRRRGPRDPYRRCGQRLSGGRGGARQRVFLPSRQTYLTRDRDTVLHETLPQPFVSTRRKPPQTPPSLPLLVFGIVTASWMVRKGEITTPITPVLFKTLNKVSSFEQPVYVQKDRKLNPQEGGMVL